MLWSASRVHIGAAILHTVRINDVPKEIRRLSTGNHTAGYADGTLMLNQCSKHIASVMVQKTWNGTVAARQSVGGLGLKMNTGKTQIICYVMAAILCPA